MKKMAVALFGVWLLSSVSGRAASWPDDLTRSERRYVRQIMKDAWRGIELAASVNGGIPFESPDRPDRTTTATLGLYLASLCMAHQLGYVAEDEAVARIESVLGFLDTAPHWNRLYDDEWSCSGKPVPGSEGTLSQYACLPAGLILVRESFPALKTRCSVLLDEIGWAALYDRDSRRLYRRFSVAKQRARDPEAPSPDDDLRLAHYLMIAWDAAAASRWPVRPEEDADPGGRPAAIQSSLFLDTRGTPAGEAAVRAAWRQIVHGLRIGAPAWGWSVRPVPGDPSGAFAYEDDVIRPHLVAEACYLFPREAVRSFRALDELGLRNPGLPGGGPGYRAEVNWRTGAIPDVFSTEQQARLFLALINYMDHGLVWRSFRGDPAVSRVRGLIPDYRGTELRRASQRRMISGFSWGTPGLYWWVKPEFLTPRPGDLLQASLWARSHCAEPRSGYSAQWTLKDQDRILAEGVEPIQLNARETRKLTDILIPTGRLGPGIVWTLETFLKEGDIVIGSARRVFRFRRDD